MVNFVLVANGIIGLVCLLIAWKLWKLKCYLAHAADKLTTAERNVHRVLYPAPEFILRGQSGTSHLRRNLADLEPQIQRIQQLMSLLSMGQLLWQRRLMFTQRPKSDKKRSRQRLDAFTHY
jgi:hypothetical protein